MNGYGKPGYTRAEFEAELDAELDGISTLDREYQTHGTITTALSERRCPHCRSTDSFTYGEY